ncbi:phage baseplate assembly protein [Novosphingobium sp. 9]|uniref:phage baseplate assembly protein n=1 Tax=Novosphingobium sp. 9 TaxID=2025349 RepID=UPI0021B67517|nr:contractile injection system protein, VgrG/Pvc8 family [Novosphingobium sp. 9]
MTDTGEIVVNPKDIDPNQLTLKIEGIDYTGWEEIEVTLRAEAFPNGFEVKASKPPSVSIPINPGDECIVKLGSDRVITGYVDRVIPGGDADTHTIAVQGRGYTQDLVDCSAEWPSHQLIGGNALTIATKLASAYGITVEMLNGASPGDDVPQWPINYGETGADIIQRLARNAGLLAYETGEGHLGLAAVGTTTAASGMKYGENVQAWSLEKSMDQRYSNYVCTMQTTDSLGDLEGQDFFHEEKDPNVTRHRLIYLVAEAVATDAQAFVQQKAKWENARRAGRSYIARAVIDSWRDSAGTLWAPNTQVPVSLPDMDAEESLVISEVTFRRTNEAGTTAELVCMRKEAFTPEPIVLQPVNAAELI